MSEKNRKNYDAKDIFRIFAAPKKGLWLTLSVVCLAGLKDYGYCLGSIGSLV